MQAPKPSLARIAAVIAFAIAVFAIAYYGYLAWLLVSPD